MVKWLKGYMSVARIACCVSIIVGSAGGVGRAIPPAEYADGRPQARLRMEAKDEGVVLKHGDGLGDCDVLGARDATVFEYEGTYYLLYDGAGRKGWLTCLATSKDLVHWEKRGSVLDFGAPGRGDSASASQAWTIHEDGWWHLFYLGTKNVTPAPNYVPMMPYQTFEARSRSPTGPWEKQYDKAPFTVQPGTYYSATASPGQIVKHKRQFLMFFAASTGAPDIKRTLGIARAKSLNGPWAVEAKPIFPPEEQIENSSLYYEPRGKTWFLFCNHIGLDRVEFTDAVWVYWSKDVNRWDAKDKAIVLDGRNCTWSKNCIGMPAVVKVGRRLAVIYDAPGGSSIEHMNRDIGLAWLELPLTVSVAK